MIKYLINKWCRWLPGRWHPLAEHAMVDVAGQPFVQPVASYIQAKVTEASETVFKVKYRCYFLSTSVEVKCARDWML
jgi:hypothetical protein